MKTNNIQLAIFDMAGTTVYDDNYVTRTLLDTLFRHGFDMVTLEAVNAVMGIAKPEAIKMLLAQFYPGLKETPVAAIHEDFQKAMVQFYTSSPEIREIEGASRTFKTLKEMGIKVGLNTGFSRIITNIVIKRLGWDKPGILDISIASDEVKNGRPYPDMIQVAMKRLSVTDSRNIAKIGDTPVDLQEGDNASCGLNIGVWSGSAAKETLQQYPHTHLTASIVDVPEMIQEFLYPEA